MIVEWTRPGLTKRLKGYRAERESIQRALDSLAGVVDELCWPSGSSMDERIQHDYNQAAQIDRMLAGLTNGRRYVRRSLEQLWQDTRDLDHLLGRVLKLPPDERNVIMACLMDGESQESYAKRLKISVSTVKRLQTTGLDLLAENP